MRRFAASLCAALVVAGTVCAQIRVYEGDINLQGRPMDQGGRPQWSIPVKVGNTGTVRLNTFYGTNVFNPSTYTVTFHAGPSRDDSGQIQISCTEGASYVDILFSTNNLAYPFDTWYSALKFVSGATIVSQPEGLLSCSGAPEVDGGAVSFTYNRDWSLWSYTYGGLGPAVGDGSTISWTTNASGRIILSAVGASASLTNLYAGPYFSITGTGRTRTLTPTGLVATAGYNSTTTSLNAAVVALNASTGVLNTATGTLNTAVVDLRSATNDLRGDVDAVVLDMTDLENATGTLNTAVVALNTATGTLNTAVGNLNTATGTLNAAVLALNNATNTHEIYIEALQSASNYHRVWLGQIALLTNGWQSALAYTNEAHTAYGWGDHATEGYLTAEADTNALAQLAAHQTNTVADGAHGGGDNLGNHTATMALNMGGLGITNVVGIGATGTPDYLVNVQDGTLRDTSATITVDWINGELQIAAGAAITVDWFDRILYGAWSVTNLTATGAFTGNGVALTNLNASNITSGTLAPARLPGSVWDAASLTGTVALARLPAAVVTNMESGVMLQNTFTLTNGTLTFKASDGDAVTILANTSGQIEINTDRDEIKFDTGAGQLIAASINRSSTSRLLSFGDTAGANVNCVGSATTSDTYIRSGSTERLRILGANGNVGIGTNAPAERLHVHGGAIAITAGATPTATANCAKFFATNAAAAEAYVMDGSGNIAALSPDEDPNESRARKTKVWNVYTGRGHEIDFVAMADALEQLTGRDDIIREFDVPRTDWDIEQAMIEANREAEIAAWESNTNAPTEKGPKPRKYAKKDKPKWLADWEKENGR